MSRMKRFAAFVGAAFLAAVLVAQAGSVKKPAHRRAMPSPQADEAAIARLAMDKAAAVRSRNVDRIMSHYLRSENLIVFDIGPQEIRGWNAYRKSWQSFLAGLQSLDALDVSDIQARAAGNLGYYTAHWRLAATTQTGQKLALDGRMTDVLQKVG